MSGSDATARDGAEVPPRKTRGDDAHVTPLGVLLRRLRRERGLALKDMAEHLGVTPAYLSALEKGRRGRPSWPMIQGMLAYFHIIWDEADELVRTAQLSDPRVRVDTVEASAAATLFANRLAREIGSLDEDDLAAMTLILDEAIARRKS